MTLTLRSALVLAAALPLSSPTLAQRQGERPPGTHQDNTPGKEWIARLERPERVAGLRIPEVIAALELKPGDVVADIGAGTGAFTLAFAKAVAPSGRALAVDIWPDLIAYVGRKARDAGVTNLETVLAKIDDPCLPPREVDVAFFHDVFHNVNDR
ncbi:MAG: class I SAM-dependent methyltransferase, partial [Vicinamibacterales bacterium]